MIAAADLEAFMRATDDEMRPTAERLQACDRVVEHFAAAGNVAAEAFALDRRGCLIWTSREPTEERNAGDDLRRAIGLASTTGDRRLEAICRADLATYLLVGCGGRDTTNIAEAVAQYRQAIPVFEQLGELAAVSNARSNLEVSVELLAHLDRDS